MSITKQLLIHQFNLPTEIIDIIKNYIFYEIKKIPENDERYQMLLTIPIKVYDPTNNSSYVYLNISEEKDYYLVYINYTIQLQTLLYTDNVHFIEGTIFSIE